MNWDLAFISTVIERGNIKKVFTEEKITPDMLKTDLARSIYTYLLKKIDCPPSVEWIKDKFPEYVHNPLRDDISDLCTKVREKAISIELQSAVNEAEIIADKNPRAAAELLEKNLHKMLTRLRPPTRDIFLSKSVKSILDEYNRLKEGKMRGIATYPWPSLQNESMGIFPSDLIFIYSTAKSGKTWILLYMAAHCYLKEKLKVLIVSKEMAPEILKRRLAAICAGINYNSYRKGTLPTPEYNKMESVLTSLNGNGEIIISDARGDDSSVSIESIKAKVDELRPNLICVDGVYLLSDSRSNKKSMEWQALSAISQDLKELALSTGVPVIASGQANRYGVLRGDRFEDMAHSLSFAQDSDIIMRICNNKELKKMAFMIKGSREFELEGFSINAKFATDFSEYMRGVDKAILKGKRKSDEELQEQEKPINFK